MNQTAGTASNGNSAWLGLPQQLAPLMRLELADLSDEIVTAIQRSIPEFGRPYDREYVKIIRTGVERALGEFVDRVAAAEPRTDPDAAALYQALGRGEMREGRSLDALHAAFRLGARLAWRRWVRVGQRAKVPPAQMFRLAEAVFAHVDELAAESIEGYAEAQAGAAGEMQRRRRRLLELLITEPAVSPQAIADLARSAHWTLPTTVAAVALAPPVKERPLIPAVLGPDVLVDLERPDPYLLVPDPTTADRMAVIERALAGWLAAVGPPVRVGEAATSLRWARRMLQLAGRGVEATERQSGVIHCTDHLSTLVLLEDEHLIHVLAQRCLAPMAHLTPKQRARMAETLLAWLECGGRAPEVARRIHVHPQTVRYRARHIEELFGDQLRDPDQRFEMEIVLRAYRLLGRLPAEPEDMAGPAAAPARMAVAANPRARGVVRGTAPLPSPAPHRAAEARQTPAAAVGNGAGGGRLRTERWLRAADPVNT